MLCVMIYQRNFIDAKLLAIVSNWTVAYESICTTHEDVKQYILMKDVSSQIIHGLTQKIVSVKNTDTDLTITYLLKEEHYYIEPVKL